MKDATIKLLFAALCLSETATDEQVLEAVRAGQSARTSGSADREMCASLTTQLGTTSTALAASEAKVKKLENELAEANEKADKAAFATEVKDCLDGLSKEGKVTPALRKGFEASCANRAAFESFKANVAPNLPVIAPPAPPSRSTRRSAVETSLNAQTHGLDRETYAELRKLGRTDDEIKEIAAYNRDARRGISSAADGDDEDGED